MLDKSCKVSSNGYDNNNKNN